VGAIKAYVPFQVLAYHLMDHFRSHLRPVEQRKIHGCRPPARPIMTASQPVYCFIRSISAADFTSPLPMTGIFTAAFTSAMASNRPARGSPALLSTMTAMAAPRSLLRYGQLTHSCAGLPSPGGFYRSQALPERPLNCGKCGLLSGAYASGPRQRPGWRRFWMGSHIDIDDIGGKFLDT